MQLEIEAKFLDINHSAIRSKLMALDAQMQQPMRLMRRVLFDYPDGRLQKDNWGFVRVRDQGDKITLAYKASGGKYAKEIETSVGSYEEICNLLTQIGLQQLVFQESKRETWRYKNVEIVLDEWPWLATYIEIEGPDEAAIKAVAHDLGLSWSNAVFGNVDSAYRHQYPKFTQTETINTMSELRFSGNIPTWLKERQ